ncbi:serine hydrolase FSH [Fusarium oxysporum]|nr:serine hydrolase FSH [Fusarium oxysporum]
MIQHFRSTLSEGPFYQWYLWDHLQKIPPAQTATNAIDNVLDIIADEGPFDGVVCFSQGAAITASVLAHYSKKNPLEPQTNLFKFAMFICGSKPFTYDGMNRIDQCGKPVVQIPTAHVVGKKDQWYKESLGLFALCDAHSAKIYDHGQGHSLPVNPQTTGVVAQMFKNLSAKANFAC